MMDWAFAYLIKSAVSTAVLYIFMRLLMERETLHGYVRFGWLCCIALAGALPLVEMAPGAATMQTLEHIRQVVLPEVLVDAESPSVERTWTVPVVWTVYFAGMAVTALLYLMSYLKVRKILSGCSIAQGEHKAMLEALLTEAGVRKKVRLLVSDEDVSPFSRFDDIVISRKDADSPQIRQILLHELAHVRYRHSADLAFAQILTLVQWFNPCAWLTKASLCQVHEYAADRFVLEHGANLYEYQLLLIKKAVGPRYHSIANSLNHSNLKNRITMMGKSNPKSGAILKSMLALPLSALLIVSFNASDSMARDKVTQITQTFQTAPAPAQPDEDGDVYEVNQVDVKPSFDGDFTLWLMKQVVYPQDAAAQGIDGRVVTGFTITPEGKLTDVQILKSPHESLSAEVMRILAMSPEWTPGVKDGKNVPVRFVIPVAFKLAK